MAEQPIKPHKIAKPNLRITNPQVNMRGILHQMRIIRIRIR